MNRYALIVASYQYNDQDLKPLVAPQVDADSFARVLGDKNIGGFKIKLLLNQQSGVILETLEDFFADKQRDDLLLFYFSGHGIKSEDGKLYFAQTNTIRTRLKSTSVSAEQINEMMKGSKSRRQIMILDCCYSGAFAKGMVAKADYAVGLKDSFEGGYGRIILTASDAMQYAFEGSDMIMQNKKMGTGSVFTHLLVEGLQTQNADFDNDGFVSVDDLHKYVSRNIKDITSHQSPKLWKFDAEGDIYVAQYPARGSRLPQRINNALVGDTQSRLRAVQELVDMLHSPDSVLAAMAKKKLYSLLPTELDSKILTLIGSSLNAIAESSISSDSASRTTSPEIQQSTASGQRSETSSSQKNRIVAPRLTNLGGIKEEKLEILTPPAYLAKNPALIQEYVYAQDPNLWIICPVCKTRFKVKNYLRHYTEHHTPSSTSTPQTAQVVKVGTNLGRTKNSNRETVVALLESIGPNCRVYCPFCASSVPSFGYLKHYDEEHPGQQLPPSGLVILSTTRPKVSPLSYLTHGKATPSEVETTKKVGTTQAQVNLPDQNRERSKIVNLIKKMGPNRNVYCPFCKSSVPSSEFIKHYDLKHLGSRLPSPDLAILSTTRHKS